MSEPLRDEAGQASVDSAQATARVTAAARAMLDAENAIADARRYCDLRRIPPDATPIIAHALDTFGSVENALAWLNEPCGALDGAVPLQFLIGGRKDEVERELSRIDYGIYV